MSAVLHEENNDNDDVLISFEFSVTNWLVQKLDDSIDSKIKSENWIDWIKTDSE